MIDELKAWAILLVPRFLCRYIWIWAEENEIDLGSWAPHVLGRILGADNWRKVEGFQKCRSTASSALCRVGANKVLIMGTLILVSLVVVVGLIIYWYQGRPGGCERLEIYCRGTQGTPGIRTAHRCPNMEPQGHPDWLPRTCDGVLNALRRVE